MEEGECLWEEGECLVDSLPDEGMLNILSNLQDAREVARCGMVSKRWRRLSCCVDRLHFVFDPHHGACGMGPREEMRCWKLGESMKAWLRRMSDQGSPAREVRCFLNCFLYQEVIDWLQPALPTLESLEIAHNMDWYHDICECPGIWQGLLLSTHLHTLVMTCHYHQAPQSTLPDLLAALPLLRIMHISVTLEPTNLTLASHSLEDVYIQYCPDCVDEDEIMTLRLDMPHLRCLKVQDMCLDFHNTPALQRLYLVSTGIYYSIQLGSGSGQLTNLKYLCMDGEWEAIEEIKALLGVTSSVEELEARWYVRDHTIPLEQILQILPKLKLITFDDSPTLEVTSTIKVLN